MKDCCLTTHIYIFGLWSQLHHCSLKLIDKFTYLGSSILSTESDINMHLVNA